MATVAGQAKTGDSIFYTCGICQSVTLKHPLILASASPRRRQLLREAGYEFSVVPPPLHEPAPTQTPAVNAASWAEALAYFKAAAVAASCRDAIVIGADTVVTHSGNIIGKPKDLADARRILSTMFGGHNNVITGLAVLCLTHSRRIITHEATAIIMRPMDPDEVDQYLATGAWRDKAGAYAIQEGGDKFVQSIHGSFSNIVGLPMEKLKDVLTQFEV